MNKIALTYNNLANKNNFVVAMLFILLMLPNILFVFIGDITLLSGRDPARFPIINQLIFLAVAMATLFFPLLLFKKLKHYFIIGFFLLPILFLESVHILILKSSISQGMIETVLGYVTNLKELIQTGKAHFNSFHLLLITLYALLYFFLFKKINAKTIISDKIKFKIALFFTITILFTFSSEFIKNQTIYKNDTIGQNLNKATNYYKIDLLNHVYPIGFFLDLFASSADFYKSKLFSNQNINIHCYQKDTVLEKQVYVLVLGETARFHNFGINGYHRNTTPLLSKIENLTSFNNVLSAANLTSISLPLILTKGTPLDKFSSFNEPSILNAFKSAGFKTYWIGHNVQQVRYQYEKHNKNVDNRRLVKSNYDEAFLNELDSVLSDAHSKKIIVMHTRGSHYRYDKTHPASFEIFKPALNNNLSMTSASPKNKEYFVNSYDNTIVYTDYILSHVIEKIKAENAVSFMYYISDHGENLFDDQRALFLHGHLNPSEYELKVPLLIWLSNKYRSLYPEKEKTLKKNIGSRISSNFTFHTFLDMANLKYNNEELNKSFVNINFDQHQPRYFLKTDVTNIQLD